MSGRILIGLLLLLALRLASVAIIAFWGETGALGWVAEALARKNELRLSERDGGPLNLRLLVR